MNKRSAFFIGALALIPVPALGHPGLDQGSVLMVSAHALAHFLGEHPFITLALAVALISLYSRRNNVTKGGQQ